MRWVLALVTAAGCYGPSPVPGAPCAPGGVCPSELECRNEICVLPGTPPSDGPPTDQGPPGDGPIRPDSQPPDGPVNASGCSDGEREGFPMIDQFPTIAGCQATWSGPQDMRADTTGAACGDDLGDCPKPADACATGWSVCGREGLPDQVSSRADAGACLSAGGADTGAYASAMSHCTAFLTTCEYDTPYPCLTDGDCSESLCCGPACSADIGCPDGLYPQTTRVAGNFASGCGALDPTLATGVLCCLD